MIRVTGFSKWYGDRQVLQEISLEVNKGETLAIMGKSGCGKSTLLRHIAGLEDGSTGRLSGRIRLFDDIELSRLSERQIQRRQIRGLQVGLLFQDGALFDFLDVEGNILWPMREHSRDSLPRLRERLREAMAMVELDADEAFLRRDVSSLSGGERKRVALARCLGLRPPIVLFDEPTAGLDPPTAAGISDLLNRLRERGEMTSVVTSHDMDSIKRVADRILWIREGRDVFQGTPEEAQGDPRVREYMEGA